MKLEKDLKPFDLSLLAENGLKKGFTTGSSATAATKAAVWMLLTGEKLDWVQVRLPDEVHYLSVKINEVTLRQSDQSVFASVIKDAGDDPDQTHKATIWVRVTKNNEKHVNFIQGEGVGLVTEAGLQIPVGQPAINPVPRAMISCAVSDCGELVQPPYLNSFDVEIGCINGGKIATKTFNPRLGIKGGISILGTTGIVEPKSKAAFIASIEIYIKVALGNKANELALAPGNIGNKFAKHSLNLPLKRIVQISNFVEFSFQSLINSLEENNQTLDNLWFIGHPGKIAKILNNDWDTHSQNSKMATSVIIPYFEPYITNKTLLTDLKQSNTTEGIIQLLSNEPDAHKGWKDIESTIEEKIINQFNFKNIKNLNIRLFSMKGVQVSNDKRTTNPH